MSNKQSNKELATSFLHQVTSGNIDEAYEKYISQHFRHHNPYFHGDRKSLLEGMKENEKQFPNKVYEVKHVLEDSELVAVHGLVKLSEEQQIAVVHLFRFENGKIAESWDIGQQIPKDLINENGMF